MTDPFDTVREALNRVYRVDDYGYHYAGSDVDAITALASIEERLREAEQTGQMLDDALTKWNTWKTRAEAAERERDETALLARVAEWREGLVNVLDHEGNYLGCMGTESWQWTLDGGIAKLKARLEAAQRERDALQHIIDCADTPLMRDVLRERDELGAALRRIADGAESNTASEVAQVARRALASGKDKP